MRTPDSLNALVDHGIIEEVLRPLMSGKEAQIYLVLSGGEPRVAKIYKEAQNRTFQNRADYTEGRKVRNSRDQRAMSSRSRHGRAQNEAAWKSAEVDMIYRLRDAGVRVPTPYHFIDGVLIMELVTDAEGFPAPRLGDLTLEPEEATEVFDKVLREVVRMLCAGVVHGDLSDFNVLMSADGPVVIDFPQAVDASSNANARKLLLRDVDNLHRFHSKFVPGKEALPYAQEMWDLYQRNALTPETRLSGKFRTKQRAVSTESVLDLIADADHDERRRREVRGLSMRGTTPAAAGRSEHVSTREPLPPRTGASARDERPARFAAPRTEPTTSRQQPREQTAHQQTARTERPTRDDRQAPRAPQHPQAPREARQALDDRQAPRAPQHQQQSREVRQTRDDRQAPRAPQHQQPAREVRHTQDDRQAPRPPQHQQQSREVRHTRDDRQAPRAPQHQQAAREVRHTQDDRQAPPPRQQQQQAPRGERHPRDERQVPQVSQRQAPRDDERQNVRPSRGTAPTVGWGQREDRQVVPREREQARVQTSRHVPNRSTRPAPQPDGPLLSDEPSDGGYSGSRNRRG